MRHYWILIGVMAAIFLGLFALVEAFDIPLLRNPEPWLLVHGPIAGLVGVALLVADVLLPVPASLVMIAHGALFGILVGTGLSTLGSLGATLFGFWIGRCGGPLLARLVPIEERRRAHAFLHEWGDLAIIVTRPIPILAETLAVLAGTSTMSWARLSLAGIGGSLPPALLYAVMGTTASRLDSTPLVFVLVLLVAGVFWMVGRRLRAPDAP